MSRRFFPQKKKTLWGTLGNSPEATAPVSLHPTTCLGAMRIDGGSVLPHLLGSSDYRHHPGQGALQLEVCTATWECLHLISEGAETTGITWGGVPITRGCAHLISEGAETTGTTQGRVSSEWECLHLISEVTDHRNQVELSLIHI